MKSKDQKLPLYQELLQEMLNSPKLTSPEPNPSEEICDLVFQCFRSIDEYNVYLYHHIDGWRDSIDPHYHASMVNKTKEMKSIIDKFEKLFSEHGWEGTGSIELLRRYPFDTSETNDTQGDYIWHVKQSSNGTSFLAVKRGMGTPKLLSGDYS